MSVDLYGGFSDCTCPQDEGGAVVSFSRACPEHKGMAPTPTAINQPPCPGSSAHVEDIEGRSGLCRTCRNRVPHKYGYASVHLGDGTTPRA